jgi:putative N-acetyltransferase (TIGR04045 family)
MLRRKEGWPMAVARFPSSSELRGTALECRWVTDRDQLAEHQRIRHEVFVAEQRIFDESDHDAADVRADTCHVVGYVEGAPAGTVRLYPVPAEDPDERLWKGDRLAVLPEYRRAGLGAPLVRYAVATAAGLGGDRMIAYIQLENIVFFTRLGWRTVGAPGPYAGIEHQKMSIRLR